MACCGQCGQPFFKLPHSKYLIILFKCSNKYLEPDMQECRWNMRNEMWGGKKWSIWSVTPRRMQGTPIGLPWCNFHLYFSNKTSSTNIKKEINFLKTLKKILSVLNWLLKTVWRFISALYSDFPERENNQRYESSHKTTQQYFLLEKVSKI